MKKTFYHTHCPKNWIKHLPASLLLVCAFMQINVIAQSRIAVLDANTTVQIKNSNELEVFIFLLPDCPASNYYGQLLNAYANYYKPFKVNFYGVFPGNFFSMEEMKQYAIDNKIAFELFHDPEKMLVQKWKATTAPSCFLIYKNEVIYHGAIDNSIVALGGMKRRAGIKHYLLTAIESKLNGNQVAHSFQNPVGCFID